MAHDPGSAKEGGPGTGSNLSRRGFVVAAPSAFGGLLMGSTPAAAAIAGYSLLQTIEPGLNPLSEYPNRDWEQVYRDLYEPDSTFHFMCGPNDTHGCLLRATVKNGVVVYADPSYGYSKATDVYGNTASARWDPRACISGISYVRRCYADRRVKGNYVRAGFKRWADEGYPRGADGLPPLEYRSGRGKEDFVKVSFAEATTLVANSLIDIAGTYSGESGAALLEAQGYDESMIRTMDGAGTRALKYRGGMPFDAPFRLAASYRMCNMMALLDVRLRGVSPDDAHGATNWDSYSWHTDLPPGHPMVSGQQTLDFDLYTAENADLITLWGMNWIATKMPDGHWLTEARLKGTKVVTIAVEYQSTTSKADRALVIRPGADGALALGLAHVIVNEGLYDEDFVKSQTDLPFLIRTDTGKMLRATEAIPGHVNADLSTVSTLGPDSPAPPSPAHQGAQIMTEELREEIGDFMVWDSVTAGPAPVTRDQTGTHFLDTAVDPVLEGEFQVTLVDGETVAVRPVFDAISQYLNDSCSPEQISAVTRAPVDGIVALARDIGANHTKTLFVTGMGPNHFFNADCKDRLILLVAALTNNIGHFGGSVGSYAGNYRLPMFSGIGQYMKEDPFDIELDPNKLARIKKYYRGESAHYYNYDDRPLRIGDKLFTGETHLPSPTKSMHVANANSILGNAKGAHNMFVNTLPKIEMIITNEWFWTATCEYSDVVFGVDSWIERKNYDVWGSVTNPFVTSWPLSPLERIFDTVGDMDVWAGIASSLEAITGDTGYEDYWRFVLDGHNNDYIQRVFDEGNTTKGYDFMELEESCRNGVPFYMMMRTSPRLVGWEQTQESKPWYTKSGRLEFYREEDEFIEAGENLPVHREPVDGTILEPNSILASDHPLVNPATLEAYGLELDNDEVEVRQVRNIVLTPEEMAQSAHPRMADGFTHVLISPKYRHACHTMAGSVDTDLVVWGPFGDFYRHDKRTPWVAEGYIDLNPLDAEDLGVEDGDYVHCDGDPSDRPFVGWQNNPDDYRVMRWLVRVRVNPSVARQVARSWFHFHIATHGSVEGHETREDGLAKNPRTGYQAGYRYGSHQSVTRAWLRPTLMTDSLVRKDPTGQKIGKGFAIDVHCTNGAPKESFVKIVKAEDGGMNGDKLWYPAREGFRYGHANEAMQKYVDGDYVTGGTNA